VIAEWNINETAAMTEEQNLRNLCRQMEQEYIDWSRSLTYKGFGMVREWPAMGEMGRGTVEGVRVRFLKTRNRTIEVQTPIPNPQTIAIVPVRVGMARVLYAAAGAILDTEMED
jgi:hypothetical protein